VIAFAYQTDRDGIYSNAERPVVRGGCRGWARTSAAGRFEFRTIRPGAAFGSVRPVAVRDGVQHVEIRTRR
jgi:protocatechuate 3,4-dioxygenase beta subunit